MPACTPDLLMPTWRENPQGEPRRVGVELEMNNVSIDQVARLMAELLGGRAADLVTEEGRYERRITGDCAGDWEVELDFDLLKRLGREHRDTDTLSGEIGESAEELLKCVAEPLVPVELVSPPLPLERLAEVETVIERLRQAGAKGTSDRLVNAFGMQLNPEIPSTDPAVLAAYLKAFACLYEWLYFRADINVSRQVTNYIDPYPRDYVARLVDPAYWPNQDQLIDDYLQGNPTRNRALDVMPLFSYLDEARVRNTTDDPLIKPRPAFHYRLPDCDIDRTDWGLHEPWNDWVQVEWLASDQERLTACCNAYTQFLAQPLERWLGDWRHEWRKELEARWLVRS